MELPYSAQGEGSPVLLLHAGIADRRMWVEHLEPLAVAGHRVIAVDLPGFGEAAIERGPLAHWEDVVETMDALGIMRAALVGTSFGAAVALRVAAVYPDRVSSLILFSAPTVPEPDPSARLLAAWEAEESAVAAGNFERAVAAVVSGWVRSDAPPEVGKRVATMQHDRYRRHPIEFEHAVDPLEQDPRLLTRIVCPVLLAVGENDMVDFRDAAIDLGEKLLRASVARVRNCGHLVPLEAPEEFRRLTIAGLS